MSKFISLVILILCACAASLNAQSPTDLTPPPGVVGTPYFCACDYGLNAVLQSTPSNQDGVIFTYSFAVTTGTVPPGLAVGPNGAVSGTPTTAGDYNFTSNIHYVVSAPSIN